MTRQCMRPGCDRRASACLTYDADSSAVWLQDPGDVLEPAQVVCSLHAETLTVPLGWTVTDRRSIASVDTSTPPVPEPQPELELDPEQATQTDPPIEPDEPPDSEAAARSRTDSRSQTDAKRRKLLDRAFEWTGPQHSVLTTEAPGRSGDEDNESG